MIDWHIVLGAFGGGLALTCWLESRHRWQQFQPGLARWLQGTAVVLICLAASSFLYAAANPPWQQAAPRPNMRETADTLPLPAATSLAPPSVFIMATPVPTRATTTNTVPDVSYLHIPALGVSQPIVDLPLENGRWDVSSLGENVGRLGSTGAYPGDTLAPVFAGHMTFPASATLETGAFANLQYATYGTELIYEHNGERTVYTVTEISRVPPEEVEHLYLADGNSILLVTCTDWDANGRVYANRLLVRAVRTN
ncbi:MAG: sortase [Anaerolineaceae bacterium]|nr:sortase [Anaerolineaceae bacterium]